MKEWELVTRVPIFSMTPLFHVEKIRRNKRVYGKVYI